MDTLFALLRWAKYGGAPITIDDYSRLYEESMRHDVGFVVLYALRKSGMIEACDEQTRYTWLAQSLIQERLFQSDTKAIEGLARIYGQNDLKMMILKGRGLAMYYPDAGLRHVGDIDIALLNGECDIIRASKAGDEAVEKALGCKIDRGKEHHTVFEYGGRTVENHYEIISAGLPGTGRYLDSVLKKLVLSGTVEAQVGNVKVCLPSPTFNAIYLPRHMAQHFAGSHILLRHVLDWAWFLDREHSSVEWDMVQTVWQKCGVTDFICAVNTICVRCLGVPEEVFHGHCSTDDALVERVLADIIDVPVKRPVTSEFAMLKKRFKRFRRGSWKRRLVYREPLAKQFVSGVFMYVKYKLFVR